MKTSPTTTSAASISVLGGLLAGWLAATAGCGAADADGLAVVECGGRTMGTQLRVTYVAVAGDPSVAEVQSAFQTRLSAVNGQMSTYESDSELSRFNASASTEWFGVSEETARVVDFCLRLAEASAGALDPTVGPLVDLWGFGPDGSRLAPPDTARIDAARARTGHAKVGVSLQPPALRKSAPSMRLDLSAAAKGFGVDAVAEALEELGVESYLVEIGGEIRTRGAKPGGKPWRIGVEAPDDRGRRVQRVIEPGDAAVATSGDYRNFFEHDGVRYSHTIDPTTGRPVTHDLATVSVLAATCLEADALATALLVMGPDGGYDWAQANGVAALFVSRTEADELLERSTPAWEAALSTRDHEADP